MMVLINQASAAEMKVVPSNQNVTQWDKFDLNVFIDPEGAVIAGVQLNAGFNNSMLNINNVMEGNFLKQSGASTIFNKYITNNVFTTKINS